MGNFELDPHNPSDTGDGDKLLISCHGFEALGRLG